MAAGFAVFLLVVAAILPFAGAPPGTNLGAWGAKAQLSRFAELLRENGIAPASIVSSPLALGLLSDPARTVYVVVGVEREYTAGEIAVLASFYDRGGALFVADDFGFGTGLTTRFGVAFDKQALRDESFLSNPAQVKNESLMPVNVTIGSRNWTALTDVPTSLSISPSAKGTVIARTSPAAYVDRPEPGSPFGNGKEDGDDYKDPRGFPVIWVSDDGRIVVSSDPQLFSNHLLARSDFGNRDVATRLVLSLAKEGGSRFLIDESRHASPAEEVLVRQLVAFGVAPTQDPFLRVVGIAGVGLAATLAMSAFQAPPALLVHESRLETRVPHRRGAAPLGVRLRDSAIHKVKIVHGIDNDAWARMGLAEGSRLVRDDRLRELIHPGSEVRPAEVAELIGRIRNYKT